MGSHFDRYDWWDPEGLLLGLHTLLDPLRVPYFRSTLERVLPSGGRVLDVGCGGGFVSRELTSAGFDVVGVDISHAAVTAAGEVGAGMVVAGEGEHLPFGDGQFDAVVCTEVLEHVRTPAQVLSEIGRVLRVGGALLFSTPHRTRLSRFVLIDLAQRFPPTRVLPASLHEWDRLIRPDELERMLGRRRFRVEQTVDYTLAVDGMVGAVMALAALKRRRISHAQAGERIRLRAGPRLALGYLGHATLMDDGGRSGGASAIPPESGSRQSVSVDWPT